MAHKRIRKNVRKNSGTRRHEALFRRIGFLFKMTFGLALLMLISFGFIFGHDFLTQCEYFKAASLRVQGNQRLSTAHVLNQARIAKGMNILSINLVTVRKRLLADSWISQAEVRRKLPDEIHIRISEHQPLAILDLGRKFLINTHGQVFKEVSAYDPRKLPVIRGLEFSDITIPGDPPSVPFEAVMHILHLGRKAESILPNRMIAEIRVDKEIGLTLYTPDRDTGRTQAIKLGYHDYPVKLSRLKDVLLFMKSRRDFPKIDAIDLNGPQRIVVSPAVVELSRKDHKEV